MPKKKKTEVDIDEMIETMAREVAMGMDYAGLVQCSIDQDIAFWESKTDAEIEAAYRRHMEAYHPEGE